MERERKRKRAKKKASEKAGKKRGETGEEDVVFPSLPSFFPVLSFALFFTRAPLSERLEQASNVTIQTPVNLCFAEKRTL